MAGSLIRIAAGAGAFAVILTVGGSGMGVSAADPGGSSHSSHSRQDDRPNPRGHEHRGSEARTGDRRGTTSRSEDSPTSTVTSRTAPTIAATDQVTASAAVPTAVPDAPAAVGRGGSSTRIDADPAPVIAPQPALPPPVVPASTLQRLEQPRPETLAASYWGTLNPGWPAGALFGLAGLILAPIAGVWMGHRQARAVKAASQLVKN